MVCSIDKGAQMPPLAGATRREERAEMFVLYCMVMMGLSIHLMSKLQYLSDIKEGDVSSDQVRANK
jgi:hypothetical protein